jgi:hypothetical protein
MLPIDVAAMTICGEALDLCYRSKIDEKSKTHPQKRRSFLRYLASSRKISAMMSNNEKELHLTEMNLGTAPSAQTGSDDRNDVWGFAKKLQ